jgi:hypothetical protein
VSKPLLPACQIEVSAARGHQPPLAIQSGVGYTTGEIRFRHHFIDLTLPQNDRLQGDYGLTALVDINRDGHLDFVVGGRQPGPERLYWHESQSADKWIAHKNIPMGRKGPFGVCVRTVIADVDGDGKKAIVSKAWGCLPWNGVGGKMHVDFLEREMTTKGNPEWQLTLNRSSAS